MTHARALTSWPLAYCTVQPQTAQPGSASAKPSAAAVGAPHSATQLPSSSIGAERGHSQRGVHRAAHSGSGVVHVRLHGEPQSFHTWPPVQPSSSFVPTPCQPSMTSGGAGLSLSKFAAASSAAAAPSGAGAPPAALRIAADHVPGRGGFCSLPTVRTSASSMVESESEGSRGWSGDAAATRRWRSGIGGGEAQFLGEFFLVFRSVLVL